MDRINLVEAPKAIEAPAGKIYSTSPREALSVEMSDVVVKGPDLGLVFAEAAAYALAGELDLAVPACGTCTVAGEEGLFFCSQKLRGRYPIDHWMSNGLISNSEVIGQTIVFDVWVANWDRNIGNFVEDADIAREGGVDEGTKVFAIDFEKAAVLRGEPDRFTIGGWPGGKFWPIGDLGQLCAGVEKPEGFVHRIMGLPEDQIVGILEQVRLDLDLAQIDWFQTTVDLLTSRAANLPTLTGEAWDG